MFSMSVSIYKSIMQVIVMMAFLSVTCIGARADEYQNLIDRDYLKLTYQDKEYGKLNYRLLRPDTVEAMGSYPLVVFLHGSGERGDDNTSQLVHGGSVFSDPVNKEKYPAYVVFPQCPEGRMWAATESPSSFMPGAGEYPETVEEHLVMELIDKLKADYRIDPKRIYIAGISMGGIGAYDLVCRHPEVFAGATVMCGAVDPDRLQKVGDIDFTIYHGAADPLIPVICGREAYLQLRKQGTPVTYIEFAGIGHECWTPAFNHPLFLARLFFKDEH